MKNCTCFLAVILFVLSTVVFSQIDSLKLMTTQRIVSKTPDTVKVTKSPTFNSIQKLNQWKMSNEGIFYSKITRQFPMALDSVRRVFNVFPVDHRYVFTTTTLEEDTSEYLLVKPVSFAFKARYFSHINAITGVLGYNRTPNSKPARGNNFWSFLAYFGRGIGPSPAVLRSAGGTGIRMQTVLGLGAEHYWGLSDNMQLFSGVNYFYNNPRAAYRYVGNLNALAGLRYAFFIGEKTNVGFELFGGSTFWQADRSIDLGRVNYAFVGTGLSANVDFASNKIYYLPFEISPMMSIKHDLLFAKGTLPVKISESSSVGLNLYGGTGIGGNFNTFGALGVEWRGYTDKLKSFFNPFIGASWGIYDVQDSDAAGDGIALHFGNKFRLMDRLSADIYGGANFWSDPWVNSATTGAVLPTPDNYDFGAGLTFYIGKKQTSKVVMAEYHAIMEDDLYRTADELSIGQEDLLSSHKASLEDIEASGVLVEKHYYVVGKGTQEIPNCPPCVRLGDVTDIKFVKGGMGFNVLLNPLHDPLEGLDASQTETTILMALFDKEKINTDKIEDYNMYLHFSDIDKSRYFGYRWDLNRRLQPEYRKKDELNIDIDSNSTSPLYYGKYNDFVKRLEWLDEAQIDQFDLVSINGKTLSQILLNAIDKQNPPPAGETYQLSETTPGGAKHLNEIYRIAFVEYPVELIKEIESVCPHYGVSIMFRVDTDGDRNEEDPDMGHFVQFEDTPVLDLGDDAFFSNTILGKEIDEKIDGGPSTALKIPDGDIIVLEGYELGSPNLEDRLANKLDQEMKNVKQGYSSVTILGYTDATPISEGSSLKGQKTLAWKRAESVMNYLIKNNILDSKTKIDTIGVGIFPGATEKQPDARQVKIIFHE